MRFIVFAALQFVVVSSLSSAEPGIITTSTQWSPLLRSFGEGAVAVEHWKFQVNAVAIIDEDESSAECRKVEPTGGSVLVYDASEDRLAEQFWRSRFEGQGVQLVEIRDFSRTHSSQRNIAALEAVHAVAVKVMPDRREQLDRRLDSEQRRWSRSPRQVDVAGSSSATTAVTLTAPPVVIDKPAIERNAVPAAK